MNLYRAIDVWKRVDESTAVRYRCLESLKSKSFVVQSADFYRLPIDGKQSASLDRQFLELLIEVEPADRDAEYATLEEAIAAHDQKFL